MPDYRTIPDLPAILEKHKLYAEGKPGGERADLSYADLRGADLSGADLSGADLSGANLRNADLSYADLSGVQGLLNAAEWLRDNFETDAEGVIVYKRIGETQFSAPSTWPAAEPGAVLTEVANPTRTQDCGCGVNFGTRAWCDQNYTGSDLWRCRIAWLDLAGVVVPYNTNGKARCERLTLIEKVG